MDCEMDYVMVCSRGQVRKKNEDNFYIDGKFRKEENNGQDTFLSGRTSTMPGSWRRLFRRQKGVPSVLAVFDGMGGEECGEEASGIAAAGMDACVEKYKKEPNKTPEQFLNETCLQINRDICSFMEKNSVRSMGTTACMMIPYGNRLYYTNIGDSRIYRFHDGHMTQLTKDDSLKSIFYKKGPLLQYLGVPEKQFVISPHTGSARLTSGDRYLMCTDGLTDLIEDQEIQKMVMSGNSLEATSKELLKIINERGARDNTTFIIAEVR